MELELLGKWRELQKECLKAELAYWKCIQPELEKKFVDETRGKIIDPRSYWYTAISEKKPETEAGIESCSSFRKLMLLIHPDKCTDPDATELCIKARRLKPDAIDKILASQDPVKSLRDFSNTDEELASVKMSLWYWWATSESFRASFIDEKKLAAELKQPNTRKA